jgi:hypothetical protein
VRQVSLLEAAMGLMDRVKAQAAQIAQQAQEVAQEGRARLDQVQASRRGDTLLRQLGATVLAERTGRGTADSQARIDQLITEISAYERDNSLDLVSPTQQSFPQPGSPQPGSPDPASPSPGGTGDMMTVDTTTSFFPAPDDHQSGAP